MATGQLITGSDNVNDNLVGTVNDDTLRGLSGDDTLNGGAGADSLEGGAGNDVYIVDQLGDKVVELAGGGADRVESAVTWTLGAEVENLTLTGTAAINGTGNGLGNSLLGNAANNRLEGGGGEDFLDGRGGADTLVGGTGNDWYVLDSASDSIIENAGEGDDTVEVSFDNYVLGSGLEYLYLIQGAAAVTATGNELGNELVGNLQNNVLRGLGGDDFLDGGAGEDVLAGGTGNDSYSVNSAGDVVQEAAGEGTDTVYLIGSLKNYALTAEVENLTTVGSAAFRLVGNALDNNITAGALSDTIAGQAGNDLLAGGAGNDLLIGDDVVTVRARADLLAGIGAIMEVRVEGTLIGTVQVTGTTFADYSFAATLPAGAATKVTVSFTNDAGDGNGGDRNLHVESVSVNGVTKASSTAVYDRYAYDGVDTLPGATGTMAWNGTLVFGFATQAAADGSDVLNGGSGADTLIGGRGDDFYGVDNLGDVVVENLNEGWDTVEAAVDNYALTDNVETLTLRIGSAAVTGTGNALDNELIGNAAGNVLRGLGGDDYFDGAEGADTLVGGTGDDSYFVTDAGDVIQELAGEGTDTATVMSVAGFTLAANVENLNVIGTGLGGTGFLLSGNDLGNRITGGASTDTLVGYAGADTLIGGAGNDRLFGDDVLVVRARSDLFQGLGGLMEVKVDGVAVGQVYVNNTSFADFHFAVSLANGVAGKITVGFLNDAAGGGADRNLFVDSITLNGVAKLPSTAVYDRYALDGVDTLPGGTGAMPWGGTLIFDYAAQASVGANDSLSGGTGVDTMSGGRGNDTYSVENIDDVVIELAGEGTDLVNASVSYTLSDNVENLTLTGTASVNATGNALVNDLRGNSGNNRLDGGAGADLLTGGLGDDTYVIDTLSDTITELLGEGNDTVETSVTYTLGATLENLRLAGSGWIDGTGNGGNNLIEGNAGNNVLDGGSGADILRGGEGDDTYVVDSQYDVVQDVADLDAQGNVRFGGTDTVKAGIDYLLDSLLENLVLTGSAVNGTGNASDNTLTGNAADNTLFGLAGADILDGGTGADVMAGGLDNDTYVVDNAGDSVLENANGGIDTVISSISWTLGSTLEHLQLSGTAATGTGNAAANLLYGNDATNTLSGLGGDDTLQGGAGGADTLIGGTGNDTYIVQNGTQVVRELAGEGTDTVRVQGLQSYTLTSDVETGWISSAGFGATTTLSLTGNLVANTLNGSFGNDVLSGDAGNDTLLGGYGRDTLAGGIGADSMVGGLGDDYYIVDEAGDRVVERDREGNDTVASDITFTLAGTFLENLQLTGLAATNGTGNDGNNQLTGNSAANTLSGGGGNDTLNGGAGNDILAGGTGNDSYVVEGANDTITELADEGIDLVTTAGSYTLGANLEQLTISGTAAAIATGNGLANLLTGNSGDNTLDGQGGIDTLVGGGGNDTYYLDNAADVIVELAGAGSYDAAYFNFSGSYTLGADNIGLETITANAGAVSLTGNDADNGFVGSSAADYFSGGAGNDWALAGAGNDTLVAGAGYDYLSGSTGADTYIADLSLGGIAEVITGDVGVDTLEIRGVADKSQLTFRRVVAEWSDTSDYANWVHGAGTRVEIGRAGGGGTVVVDLFKADGTNANRLPTIKVGTGTLSYDEIRAAVTFTASTGNDRLYGFSAADTLSGGDGNDSIEGAGGNDVLSGGAGHDSLSGGAGSDNLDGGTGNDTLYGADSADVLNGGSGNDSYVLAGYASAAVSSVQIVDNDATVGNSDSLSLDFNPYRTLFQQVGNDLRISAVGASNGIVVKDWYVGGTANHIETLKASGWDTANAALIRSGTLTDAKVQSLVTAMSGFAPTAGQTQFTDTATLNAINAAWAITTQPA